MIKKRKKKKRKNVRYETDIYFFYLGPDNFPRAQLLSRNEYWIYVGSKMYFKFSALIIILEVVAVVQFFFHMQLSRLQKSSSLFFNQILSYPKK